MTESKLFKFGSNDLTNFLFKFIGSPFKLLRNKLTSTQTTSIDQTTQTNHHHQNYVDTQTTQTDHEISKTEHPTEPSPTSTHRISQPLSSIENSLPTAFMPHFPSLSRPSTSTLHSNQSISNLAPSSSSTRAPKYPHCQMPSRRTLYIGPGHSSMNSSTRLGIARRKRLGASNSSSVLGSNYDTISQAPPKSPQGVQHKLTRDSSEEQTPKRIKINDHSDLSSPSRNQLQSEPSHFNQVSNLPPPKVANANLRAIKNSNMTPMRPSPLRNVTLPSAASSPASQPDSSFDAQSITSSLTKKRHHKKAAMIMSSVMKEVDLEISSRSPAPSPIKASVVINPYAHLQQRTTRNKPASRSAAGKNTPAHPTNNLQDSENRKRKVQVCLDGDVTNHPIDSMKHDQINHTNSNQNPIEHILQETMPKEFRPEYKSDNVQAPKRKTRQVGKVSERLLKKRELREREARSSSGNPLHNKIINTDNTPPQNNNSRPSGPSNKLHQSPSSSRLAVIPSSETPDRSSSNVNPSDKTSSRTLRSATEQSPQLKANQLNNSKPFNLPSPSTTKTFRQVPSVSLLESTNLNSKSAATRSSLWNASNQLISSNENNKKNDLHFDSSSSPDSSTNINRTTVITQSLQSGQNPSPSIIWNTSHQPQAFSNASHLDLQKTEKKDQRIQEKGAGEEEYKRDEEGKAIEKKEGNAAATKGGIQASQEDDENIVMNQVKELQKDEIQKHFNHDLFINDLILNNHSSSLIHSNDHHQHQHHHLMNSASVKETVLGFNSNELNSFVFL